MKGPASFGQALTILSALSSTAAAWPSWLPPIDALVVRQDSSSSTAPQQTSTPAGSTTVVSETGSTTRTTNRPVTTGNLNTGGITQTGSGSVTQTASGNSTQTTRQAFNPQDPAGGVNMISPVTTTGSILYRIGETITFKWNYTSLQGTPTAIDLMVTCTAATKSWTLTQNMSYEATGTFTWDTHEYSQTAVQSPLLTEEYALLIYDADSNPTQAAEAGYLAPYDRLKFGLYTARPYSNLSDWSCVTCSAANGDLDRKALGFAVTMATITVLSFTWFVTGLGGLP